MSKVLQTFVSENFSDWDDDLYGPGFRCSATLNDGTELPCVIIRQKQHLTDLALKRIKQEKSGRSVFANVKNPYRNIVEHFVASGNKINDYDVRALVKSRFAIPNSLLAQIEGETHMGWTGWVFEMKDGRIFSFGSTLNFAFFDLPEGYNFFDVAQVHNHSLVDETGSIIDFRNDEVDASYYNAPTTFRERIFFECYINDV